MMSNQKGKVVVIAGPAGVGKNSIIDGVIKSCNDCVDLITATTRQPRPGEQDGIDYFFMTPEQFEEHVKSGNIPEFRNHPSGARYGTFLPYLSEQLENGKTVLGDINIDGARYLKDKYSALSIFIMPPSFDVLEKRIRARNADMPEDELKKRLDIARHEIEIDASWYDYRVVNKENMLDEAVSETIEILKKEGYVS
jgi:guanylate kinase